jgi:hypothetical protein
MVDLPFLRPLLLFTLKEREDMLFIAKSLFLESDPEKKDFGEKLNLV